MIAAAVLKSRQSSGCSHVGANRKGCRILPHLRREGFALQVLFQEQLRGHSVCVRIRKLCQLHLQNSADAVMLVSKNLTKIMDCLVEGP